MNKVTHLELVIKISDASPDRLKSALITAIHLAETRMNEADKEAWLIEIFNELKR